MTQVPFSVAMAREPDETARLAIWSVPLAHAWETWSDARGHDGTAVVMQPQALPLYGGMSAQEMLIRFAGSPPPSDLELVQATWRDRLGQNFEQAWHDTLAQGVVAGTASATASVTLKSNVATLAPLAPAAQETTILFRPDPSLWDGRYANNPWLQELPRPLTKLTWDNPLLVSPEIARQKQLNNGDQVVLRVGDRGLIVPVWIQPGQAPDVVLAWLGGGRRVTGAVGENTGFDFYPLTGGTDAARIEKTRGRVELASTIHHAVLFGADGIKDQIVKHTTLPEFQKNTHFAQEPEQPNLYRRKPPGPAAWAMSVDLNSCIGCNACVIACQAENNVPTVGKEQVLMEREMHWLRIDRYYEGNPGSSGGILSAGVVHALRERAMRGGLPARRDSA